MLDGSRRYNCTRSTSIHVPGMNPNFRLLYLVHKHSSTLLVVPCTTLQLRFSYSVAVQVPVYSTGVKSTVHYGEKTSAVQLELYLELMLLLGTTTVCYRYYRE